MNKLIVPVVIMAAGMVGACGPVMAPAAARPITHAATAPAA